MARSRQKIEHAVETMFGQLNEKEWLKNGIAFGVKQEKLSPSAMQEEPAQQERG